MLSPTQRAMIAALCTGDPVPMTRLGYSLYAARADGGPDDPDAAVRIQVLKMRAKLARIGVEIETVGEGRLSRGYRVKPEHVPIVRSVLMMET